VKESIDSTAIIYPLYDISEYGWHEFREKEHNIIFQNPYAGIVPCQKKRFRERMMNYEFVDCNGVVYKVADISFTKPHGIRGFFTLASLIDLKFNKTGHKLTLEEFRKIIIDRAVETGNKNLEETALQANSISEILKPGDI
jgi:hypothetical protein